MMKQEKNGILILRTCICGINYINNEYYQNNSLGQFMKCARAMQLQPCLILIYDSYCQRNKLLIYLAIHVHMHFGNFFLDKTIFLFSDIRQNGYNLIQN